MKIEIDNGVLFVNKRMFCYMEVGNGRKDLPPGTYDVAVGTAFHLDGSPVLPEVIDIGWIGSMPGCDIILGRVKHRGNLIGSWYDASNLIHHIERAENAGETVTLEVAKQ